MTAIIEAYNSVFSEEAADPRVYNWPLISGTWKILAIIIIYLLSVYIILPVYMKNRKPYNLRKVILIYNVYQIVACTVLAYGVATSGWTTHYTLGCQPVDYSEDKMAVRMATYMWWHLIIKIVDLIETSFYVLRKKYDQVSTLHVYHHVSVVFTAWLVSKYAPGGMASFTVPLNSFIHVLMYSYYLLASLGPNMQAKLKGVKPKLTTLQIIQLTIIVIHSMQTISPNCPLTKQLKWIYALYIPSVALMIVLFLGFYVKSFMKQQKKNI